MRSIWKMKIQMLFIIQKIKNNLSRKGENDYEQKEIYWKQWRI